MKKSILLISITIGIYFITTNFPKNISRLKLNNCEITIITTHNYLVFRDPEYTKYIIIKDNEETIFHQFWSEVYPMKIFHRKNKKETFWVIDDYYRGISRSQNGKFKDFICDDCSGIQETIGENISEFHFINDQLIIIDSLHRN